MAKPLAVLIVEDSESDVQLIVRLLRKEGYQIDYLNVDTAERMRAALQKQAWDIVISDYSLPQFNGNAALKLLQEEGLDIPFIIVSGTMGEETAVAMMKAGAHDYLMKGNLTRLVPAIERELEQAKMRRERAQARNDLRASENRFRALIENSTDAISLLDASGNAIYDSPSAPGMLGYGPEDWIGKNAFELMHPDDLQKIAGMYQKLTQTPGAHVDADFRAKHKNGSWL
jgi:PAS domain S-box-containing protein